MQSDFSVFIARCQPPHKAHIDIIRQALNDSAHIIVILGSHRAAPDPRNPWKASERESMLRSCFTEQENKKITCAPVRDYYYNEDIWLTEVQQKVREVVDDFASIALVGHKKDQTSYYLDLFPQWLQKTVAPFHDGLNATRIRESYFENLPPSKGWSDKGAEFHWSRSCLEDSVIEYLKEFQKTERFETLVSEYNYIKEYKQEWAKTRYPVTFSTADCVVTKSGHILLIRRRVNPGKGLLALPGGFINPDELILDSAVRELKEETRIRIERRELKSYVVNARVFDHPRRSLRGRTITHAFHIKLPETGPRLPSVKGGDDAKTAVWTPFSDLGYLEEEFFEDHLHIITNLLNRTV
jgi:bifunctional NMN adenylyltransferase/nudix hydrolase